MKVHGLFLCADPFPLGNGDGAEPERKVHTYILGDKRGDAWDGVGDLEEQMVALENRDHDAGAENKHELEEASPSKAEDELQGCLCWLEEFHREFVESIPRV